MCVFDPSSLTLCSPLVPITVAYSPIATSATALCPALPTLSTHHHLSPLPTHHHHHHHLPHQPPLQLPPPPPPLPPPPPQTQPITPQSQSPPQPPPPPLVVTSSITSSQVVTTTSPPLQHQQQQPQSHQPQHHQPQQATITTLPLPPPPPPPQPQLTSLSLIPPPTSTTGYYIQAPPPPPPSTTSSINGCPPLIKPSPWNQSYGMEHVWMAHFTSLFKSYPHQWCIIPVEHRPLGGNFSTFVDSAKVRFCCEDCGHGWTSMKGRVAFWFDLTNYAGYPSQGLVAFKLFGQQCQKCKAEIYEPPMWYPEEVFKVLVNLFNKVGQNYYGFYYPPLEKTRRPGKPRTPHNSTLCQACKDGVCTNRK